MSSTPNITKNTFNRARDYFGRIYQKGKKLFDWDVNDHSDQIIDFYSRLIKAVSGDNCLIGSGGRYGLDVNNQSLELDFVINSGYAVVNGRVIQNNGDINYTDLQNHIIQGQITNIISASGGSQWKITDSEKRLSTNYKLVGCVFRLLTGVEAGNEFEIVNTSGQEIIVSGDLSSVTDEDNYIILPPRLEPNTSGLIENDVYLVTWWETISAKEENQLQSPYTQNTYNLLSNNALYDPVEQQEPSQRKQLRWCVWVGYGETTNTNPMSDFASLKLGTYERNTGDDVLTDLLWVQSNNVRTSNLLGTANNLINQENGLVISDLTLNDVIVSTLRSLLDITVDGDLEVLGSSVLGSAQAAVLEVLGDVDIEGLLTIQDSILMEGGTLVTDTIRPYDALGFVDIIKAVFYQIKVNEIYPPSSGANVNIKGGLNADGTITTPELSVGTITGDGSIAVNKPTTFTSSADFDGAASFSGLMSLPDIIGSLNPFATFTTRFKFTNATSSKPDIISDSSIVASGCFVWNSGSGEYELESSVGIASFASTSLASCEVILTDEVHDLIDNTKTIPFALTTGIASLFVPTRQENISYTYTYADKKIDFILTDSTGSTDGFNFTFQINIPYL